MALLILMTWSVTAISQEKLEVDGKVKITTMDASDSDSIVVWNSDGTLGRRQVSSLSNSLGNYGIVVNPITGKVWLDRNLGATQVATSSIDADSYGDLYQWGRGADGHQVRTSDTTSTIASIWWAGIGSWSGLFITTSSDNWLSSEEIHMWSSTAGENNPCPSGFRIPTNAEWEQERLTWNYNNAEGAIQSTLKLPMGGYRYDGDGSLVFVGSAGRYWGSTVGDNNTSSNLFFNSDGAFMSFNPRSLGRSVRCIKD